MARTVAQIKQQIIDNINADSLLGTLLTSTSKRSIFGNFAFIIATAIAAIEQIIDIFAANMETIAATAAPSTAQWLQAQILKFQYSATNPQNIQMINFSPSYPVVDTSLQIVTQCSVTTTVNGQVQIKVAKGGLTPAALSNAELSALQGYLLPPNGIGIAGVNYSVNSLNSDKLFFQAQIYFRGSYSAVIQTNVVAAINAFLAALPFNGTMRLSDLEAAIKAVAGVNDVVMNNVSARPDTVAFGSGTSLVTANAVIARLWNTVAGYMTGETTAGSTLNDTITYIAE